MKTFVFIVIFLLMGAFFIISNNNLSLIKGENTLIFAKMYFSWISTLTANFVISGNYLINLEWMPETINEIPGSLEQNNLSE